ncbi:MAG: tRNA1(Val) (adenine(37)-N6)-methyltransferase [Defluviitaleaceae bacterium]|nr:tRNA1(Val) (adenine(37)-N6)-methyltransferase [Defluviitaleaceae bacterium]
MFNDVTVHPCERVDDLQCGGYHIIQNPNLFCFGIDAVCLANFAVIKKGETVLDLCTGTGIIPILLCAKTEANHITGLEIQPESVDMARRSILMNNLSQRVRIDCGDIKKGADIYPPNHFDVVTVNPPYMNHGGGVPNETSAKAIARHEIACNLADVVTLSARLLKTGGRLYMVHRPHRLVDVLCTLRRANMEPKTIQFVQGKLEHEPSLVLIEAVDHGKPMVRVLPVKVLEG